MNSVRAACKSVKLGCIGGNVCIVGRCDSSVLVRIMLLKRYAGVAVQSHIVRAVQYGGCGVCAVRKRDGRRTISPPVRGAGIR